MTEKGFPIRMVLKFQTEDEVILVLKPSQIKRLVKLVPGVFDEKRQDMVPFVGFIRRVPGDVISRMRQRGEV